MPRNTHRYTPPHISPELYHVAKVADITNPSVPGFYTLHGVYWHKATMPKTWVFGPPECQGGCKHTDGHACVQVMHRGELCTISHDNVHSYYVREKEC